MNCIGRASPIALFTLVAALAYLAIGAAVVNLRFNNQLGLVQIVGPIYSFQEITDQMITADEDPRIKALIIYVNSPGGAAFACMEIRRYLESTSKPNIAIMGEIAASGGYYVASAADEIMAHANTITGALGVISVWVDYSEWMKKEGIKFWVWKTGPAKDLYEPWRPPTAEENETISRELNKTYEILVADIARGRPNLTMERLQEIANGSAYSGQEALELGLIDSIGDRHSAVSKIASRAMIGTYFVRDMAYGDRSVLAGLIVSYLLSGVTFGFIALLACIGVLRFLAKRRSASQAGPRRMGI